MIQDIPKPKQRFRNSVPARQLNPVQDRPEFMMFIAHSWGELATQHNMLAQHGGKTSARTPWLCLPTNARLKSLALTPSNSSGPKRFGKDAPIYIRSNLGAKRNIGQHVVPLGPPSHAPYSGSSPQDVPTKGSQKGLQALLLALPFCF